MYRKSFEIIGYAYDAAYHCPECASKRFTASQLEGDEDAHDSEGNAIHPLFLDASEGSESCDDCLQMLDV